MGTEKPVAMEKVSRRAGVHRPDQAIRIRSHPEIFYFWPTLLLAFIFMAWAGILELPHRGRMVPGFSADSLQRAISLTPKYHLPVLDDSYALLVCLLFAAGALVHIVLVILSNLGLRVCEVPGNLMHRRGPLGLSAMRIIYGLIVVFLLVSPHYGLLVLYTLFTLGLMTDHDSFSQVRPLRIKLVASVLLLLVAVFLGVVRTVDQRRGDSGPEGVGSDPAPQRAAAAPAAAGREGPAPAESDSPALKVMSMVFFLALAFNLFVLAFDFHGATLITLLAVLGLLIMGFVVAVVLVPDVARFATVVWEMLLDVRINSSFYKCYAYILSVLMVFSGFVAKADYWSIDGDTVTHTQGLWVQRNHNLGNAVNLQFSVNYPDFFETLLGFGAGQFVFHFPGQPRAYVVDHVWRATKYNQQLQELTRKGDA